MTSPNEPYSFDLAQMLLGDQPPIFLLEIALRTAIIYAYTLLLVRVIGKRGMGQVSVFDFLIVIALGSAVGDPMFYPEVPLVHSMLVITVVVLLQRLVSFVTEKSSRAQSFIEGDPRRLVHDGVVDVAALEDEQLEREELFSSLRCTGIEHLGEVARAYIEPSGHVSVIRRREPIAGRPLIPPCDPDPPPRYRARESPGRAGTFACVACGACELVDAGQAFPEVCGRCRCEGEAWLPAVLPEATAVGDALNARPHRAGARLRPSRSAPPDSAGA